MKIFGAMIMCLVAGTLARPSENPDQNTSRTDGKRLIKFNEIGPGEWLTPDEVDVLASKGIKFMDITDHQTSEDSSNPPKLFAIPTSVRFQSTVTAVIPKLSTTRMQQFLTSFTAYFNRYYTSPTGVESSNWLFARIQNIINTSGYKGNVTVRQWTHTWAQKSIVARIQGTNPSTPTEVIILSAHLDSVTSGSNSQAPGADDNGTGSTCILEALSGLLESGFIPKTNIEFHWYAAEEVGLRGSLDISTNYKNNGVDVVAVSNFDMCGHLSSSNPRISFITDYTNPELNAFYRKIVDAYSKYTWINDVCGYACSDHASWYNRGFKTAFPQEDELSPYYHTVRDTIANIKFEHILEFSKIAVGFAIELSEPSTVATV